MKFSSYIVLTFVLFLKSAYCQNIRFQEIGINTKDYNEFAPTFTKGGLIFVSNRKNHIGNTIVKINEQGKEEYLNDLFFASYRRSDSSQFSVANVPFNKIDLQEGPGAMNASGDWFIFTRNVRLEGKKNKDRLSLYQTRLVDGNWTEPEMLPFANTSFNYAQPSIDAKNKVLYFVSDLSGGLGAIDIWKVSFDNDKWGEPLNLGSVVNTSSNDVFPYYSDNGNLYFGSDRPKGLGGFDIYYINDDKVFSLPAPFNSEKNDYSLITKDGNQGFVSSNRKGTDDIYFYQKEIIVHSDCIRSYKPVRCFTLFDTEPLSDSIPFTYKWFFGDGQVGYGRTVEHCFDQPGDYNIELRLMDNVTGVEYKNVANYSLTVKPILDHYIVAEHVKEDHIKVHLQGTNDDKEVLQSMVWEIDGKIVSDKQNIDFDSANLEPGYHNVKVYGIEKDSSCYQELVFSDFLVLDNPHMVLIADYFEEEAVVTEDMQTYIKQVMLAKQIKSFKIIANKTILERSQKWIESLKQELSFNFELPVELETDDVRSSVFLVLD
jgi:PKD domain/WD40-like Beta Propeller Repeat